MHQKVAIFRKTVISLLSIILLSSGFACEHKSTSTSTTQRNPQQAGPASEEDQKSSQEKYQQVFATLLNQPSPEATSANFNKYFHRQLGIFFIAQGYVTAFDKELEKIYSQKLKTPQAEVDTTELDGIRFQLLIIYEFYERNLHEMTAVYKMLLETASSPLSKEQVSARYILSSMKGIFEKSFKQTGDQKAIISLAQDFQGSEEEFKEENPQAQTPGFLNFYIKKSKDKKFMEMASQQSLKHHELRQRTHVDSFLEKEWKEFQADRAATQQAEIEEYKRQRTPQTDDLYPNAGGKGHITGNMFKPGYWAITFDDGPHPTHTLGMFKNMKDAGYPATFFWLSQNVLKYPEIVKQAGQMGFKRASHSYTHANLPKLNDQQLDYEINQAAVDFKKIVGNEPTFFRCPYGACANNSNARAKIANRGMMHVFWNVDSLDWQDKNATSVFERAKKQMVTLNKGIVLFHDIHPQSVEASRMLTQWMKKEKPQWKVLDMSAMFKEETGKDFPSP